MSLIDKLRLTWEAVRTIWRGDAALVRVPTDPAERRPMCTTLADCAKTCHQLDQARAMLSELPETPR